MYAANFTYCMVVKLPVSKKYDIALNICIGKRSSSSSTEKLRNSEFHSVCSCVWDIKADAIRGTKGTQKFGYPEVEIIRKTKA